MSQVIFTKVQLNAADMPKANPFLNMKESRSTVIYNKEDFPGLDVYPHYGIPSNSLPYTQQDYYTRELSEREVDAIVVENDILRAVFLPHCGCRLWSLYHKKKNKELLYVNPTLRFANFAIRDAWVAGGVEWNIGWSGHTVMTCETLFCERVIDTETGTPVLRFYEFERRRQQTYEVDAYLPDGSEYLMVRVRIKNNTGETVPVYWWSNMAVPESRYTRVVVDSNEAFHFDPTVGRISMADVRKYAGLLDATYPATFKKSLDFFFNIPKENRKFVTALEPDGTGLVQVSTDLLQSRKQFLWGTHSGGQRWQAFLSDGTKSYLEIQAGLGHTQMESVPLGADGEFEWLEAYGLMEVDPQKAHSYDWEEAKTEVRSRLDAILSAEFLNAELARTRRSIVGVPGELLLSGSGWGALENKRRAQAGEPLLDGYLAFPETSLTEEQLPWIKLLEEGVFSEPKDILAFPVSSMSQTEWAKMLEKAVKDTSDHWFTHYQLGAFYYAKGQKDAAKREFEISLADERTPWNLYALAQMEEGGKACGLMGECVRMLPGNFWAVREAMAMYKQNDMYDACCKLYEDSIANLQDNGRLRSIYMEAAVELGKLDIAEQLLNEPFEIADLREGALHFHDIWVKYAIKKYGLDKDESREEVLKKYPVPAWMDYKMQ